MNLFVTISSDNHFHIAYGEIIAKALGDGLNSSPGHTSALEDQHIDRGWSSIVSDVRR